MSRAQARGTHASGVNERRIMSGWTGFSKAILAGDEVRLWPMKSAIFGFACNFLQILRNHLSIVLKLDLNSSFVQPFSTEPFSDFQMEAKLLAPRSPEEQSLILGVRIDTDVALRLTRTLWEVLSNHDPVLRDKLTLALQSEIDGLALQEELDEGGKPGNDGATLQILKLYQTIKAA